MSFCLLFFKRNFCNALVNPVAVKVTTWAPPKHRNETSQLTEVVVDSVPSVELLGFAPATCPWASRGIAGAEQACYELVSSQQHIGRCL